MFNTHTYKYYTCSKKTHIHRRVPSKICLGLPDPTDENADHKQFAEALSKMNEVLFSGFEELSADEQYELVEHVMNKENWARLTKRKAKPDEHENKENESTENKKTKTKQEDASSSSSSSSFTDRTNAIEIIDDTTTKPTTALVAATQALSTQQRKGHFVMPSPGVGGAIENILQGKTFVMSGVFPEVGGGIGLSMGKDKIKRLIQQFGGNVRTAISGVTDVLICGKGK